MRKLILPIAVSLVLLISAPCVRAQDEERPEFKMPCAEVLKLGLDKFVDVYGEQTQDYSTYGMKQAYAYYVDCKRPANDAQARRLTEARRKQSEAARDQLSKLGNAVWNMVYIEAGGGTMWGLMSVSAYGAREDFMTTLITALAQEKSQPAALRRANASLAKSKRLLTRFSRVPKMDKYGWDNPAEMRKSYLESFREAQAAFVQLEKLVREMPDVAAERAARRVLEELTVEE